MPARYKPPVRCTCIECIATKDVDGTPGRYFPANEYRTHQRRITQAAQQDVDQITARLLAATLTDEGVQADDSPLWKSRSEFQENIRISPPALAEPTMLDVQEALQNLTLSSDLSTLRQSPSPTRHISHRGLTRFQSATNTARRNKDKKKYSTAIVRASKILQNVEQRAQLCEERLTSLGSETNSHTILQELEKEIDLLFTATNKISCHDETVKQKKHDTVMMITRIDGLITEVRNLVPVPLADSDPIRFTTDHHYEVPVDSLDVVAQCAIFLGAICSVIMGVSRRGGDFIMSVVAFVIGLMLRRTGKGDSNALDTSLLSQIPTSISAVLKKFNLEGKVKVYATCPACHFNYEPTFNKGSSIPIYPSHCSNILKKKFRLVPNGQPGPGICGAAILQANPDSSGVQKPIKSFVYHLFNDYLAGLTSRHDIESMMDRSCDDVMTSQDEPPPLVEGPFDADFMKTFKGPDGRLFVDRQGEGRYAFSLNIDFFNAEGMRVRGATASYGIISMACLNLPIEIRYKPENMYLAGIVPGPTEPLDQELNHYLRPLVSDLAVSWERGVHLTRTATYPDGRLTRSAVVAAVCDLPAARKLAQLASHSSHWFCSVCQCRHLPNRNRTDVEHTDWNPPDNDQRRKYAESSRDATTWEEQEQIFKETGVRWSEMWNLPYWNPSRQLVVDSMHCLLEGLISHHARYVLGLTKMASLAKEVPVPAFHWPFRVASTENNPHNLTDKEIKQVHQIHALLTSPDNHSKVITENVDDSEKEARQTAVHISEQLQKKNMSALRFVCEDLDCTPNHVLGENGGSCIPAHIPVSIAGTCMGGKLQKVHWVRALMEWRTNHLMDVDSSRHPTSSIKYGTPAVMKQIKTVIRETVTPSWVNSVPYNFGDAAAGTLKADEWRSMATIYLPIALVLSWGQGSSHSSSDIGRKLRDVLDHTMTLFSATRLACMRTMTASRALRYRENMIAYLNGLGKLHPHIPYRTNHHMALHIYDFIKLFGPVHSWWCFPFERLIGILQRQPSNHRYGQLESTMLHTFIKAGKLRRWLAKSDCPPVIKELKKLFDKSYTSKIDDDASTQRWDDGDSIFVEPPQVSEDRKQHTSLPADLSPLIKNRKVHLQARAHFDGRTYSRSSTHLGNSLIQFYPGGDRSKDLIPGSIKYIFTHNDTITYAIQRQLAAPEGTVDPFEAYPQFPAQIYSSKLSQTLELVRPAEVLSHYARFDTTEETSVVLSLSRF